jgi:MFS family permease
MTHALRKLVDHPLIFPLYVPTFIFSFCQGLLLPILPLYVSDFDVSYSLIGLVLAGEGLGMLMTDIPTGMMLRRFSGKRAMLVGIGFTVLSVAALIWAQSIFEALIYRLVAGFGLALFSVSRHAFIAETTGLHSRGRALALFGGLNRIGAFIGPAMGGQIAASYGLRAPFLLFVLAGLAVMLIIALALKEHLPQERGGPSSKPHHYHLLLTLKTYYRLFAVAGVGQLFAQMIWTGRTVIIPLYAADILGLGVQDIGLIFSISAAVDMSLFYPAGYLMDQYGRKYAIVPSFLFQAIGMALIPFAAGFMSLLLVASIISFGNGLSSGTMLTVGADLAPPEARGEFLGIWRLIGDLGSSGGPLVVGNVANWVALPTAALVLSAAGIATALIFMLFVPETLKSRADVKYLT